MANNKTLRAVGDYRAPLLLGQSCDSRDANKKAFGAVQPLYGPAIKKVFERYAMGNDSFSSLAEFLTSLGDRTFTKRSIEVAMSNRFYLGEMFSRGRFLGKGCHETLVDLDTWNACQKLRGIRGLKVKPVDDVPVPKAYMRMMKCAECGHSITGKIKRRQSRSYTYYHCAHHGCQQHRHNVSEQVITDQLIDAFPPFQSLTPEGLNKL